VWMGAYIMLASASSGGGVDRTRESLAEIP
jgi:hypothetical protein